MMRSIVKNKNTYFIDAVTLSEQAGSAKATNIVMLGAVCALMNLDKDIFLDAVKSSVPEKFLELNVKAFNFGYNTVNK